MRRIVAYCDRYDIDDPEPQAPARGIEETTRTNAHADYETLRTQGPAPERAIDPEDARSQQRAAKTLAEQTRRQREQNQPPRQTLEDPAPRCD